jgi:hypothetical protein
VLVQATPDRSDAMTIATRRDSFCGKMSACNNLMQYGIPYSLTTLHTEALSSAEFKADLEWFSQVCRVVKGLEESAHRRHWRASHGLQHGALLRAHLRDQRHHHRDARPVGSLWAHQSPEGHDDAAQAKLAQIKSYVTTPEFPTRRC